MPVKELLDYNVDVIKELVEAHTTTRVFVNTRSMTETVVQKLRLAGLQGVEGHHGSMDKSIRLDVEQKLKNGHLRAVVSSSLAPSAQRLKRLLKQRSVVVSTT